MSPLVITYLGFTVATLILIWALIELKSRMRRRKKIESNALDNWVPLHPSPSTIATLDDEEHEEDSEATHHSRAQQNGHYSESKKLY